jgi:hypothetical protein
MLKTDQGVKWASSAKSRERRKIDANERKMEAERGFGLKIKDCVSNGKIYGQSPQNAPVPFLTKGNTLEDYSSIHLIVFLYVNAR